MTTQSQMLVDELLAKASFRAQHMAGAIQWISIQCSENSEYKSTFFELVADIVKSAVSGAVDAAGQAHGPGGLSSRIAPIRQVHFCAVGKSGGVARLAVSMLQSVGILSQYLHPVEAIHGDLGSVCDDDVVVFISNGGTSAELLSVIPLLKERHCRLYAITGKSDSPLAGACDRFLRLPPMDEDCPLGHAPITSTVTSMALCQLLVAATIEQRTYDVTEYAKNHPGGSIGRRIYVKVSDLMMKGDLLPLAKPEDSFSNCVSLLTKYATGVLLITDANFKLLGIIGEKDIRQAMEKCGASVFEFTAKQIMNANPILLDHDVLADDALHLMKDRPRPLNFLPVVDSARRLHGLIRLHDLVLPLR